MCYRMKCHSVNESRREIKNQGYVTNDIIVNFSSRTMWFKEEPDKSW